MKICPKCGRYVIGEETFLSDLSGGIKYFFEGVSIVTDRLKKVPVINISGMLVSFGCDCISKAIPSEFEKYKCSCGYSWIKKK